MSFQTAFEEFSAQLKEYLETLTEIQRKNIDISWPSDISTQKEDTTRRRPDTVFNRATWNKPLVTDVCTKNQKFFKPTAAVLLADYVTTENGRANGVHCGLQSLR